MSECLGNNLIDHDSQYVHWTRTQRGDKRQDSVHLPSTILGKIEMICSVRIKDSQERLTIIGDTKEATARAIRKLDIIEETLAFHTSTHDYLVLEGAASCKLQLIALKDIPDLRLRTTLLLPNSPYYKCLAGCCVIAMIKNEMVCRIQPSAQNEDAVTYLWQGHPLSLQSSHQEVSDVTVKSEISQWIATSNAAPILDPFAPGDEVPTNVPTKKLRKVKAAIGTPQPAKPPMAATHQLQPSISFELTKVAEAQIVITRDEAAEQENQQDTTEQRSRYIPKAGIAKEGPFQSHADPQRKVESLNHQPPSITGPFMPLPSMMPSTVPQDSSNDWELFPVLSDERTDFLIGSEYALTTSPKQRVQQFKKHNVMNQQKPQVIAGSTAHVKRFEQAVLNMLTPAISRPATKLHVDIGRILIDRNTIQHDFRKTIFDVKGWANVSNGLKTGFTEMLTSKHSDATDILNLKLMQGRRLFVGATIQRKVIYSILCQTRSNECILIEILEDKQFRLRGSRFVNGAVNWHFVHRAWDARLVLSSEDFIGGDYALEVRFFVLRDRLLYAELVFLCGQH